MADALTATPILATSPTSPPVVTYDRWWLNLQACPPHPDQPMPVTITLRKYGHSPETGKSYFDPDTPPVVFRVEDLRQEMVANPIVAEAFALVIEAATSMAHVRDLL